MSRVRGILQWNIRVDNFSAHINLICPVYVVYNGISHKNKLLEFMDLKCPVYVVFYDGTNLSNLRFMQKNIWLTMTLCTLPRHPDIFVYDAYAVWTLPRLIDLICLVYVTFYNIISYKIYLWSTIRSNMSSVRNLLPWNIIQNKLLKHKLDLICLEYVTFYNGISSKNNILTCVAQMRSNMSRVRILLQ